MGASLIGSVFDTLNLLWAPIARRINYARNLQKKLEELCDKALEVGTKRNDITNKIDQLKLEKTPTEECKSWITKVGEMENKIETIKKEIEGEKKCLRGLCPDIFARLELGERVVKMIGDIQNLLDKSKFEDGFVTDAPPAKVEKQPDPTSKLTTSTHHMLETVLDKIQDKSTPNIGIWGMGGIGKTTVLRHLNNTLEITTMFDIVIWVTVSKYWSIRKLQDQIVQRLSIKITDESNDKVASLLLRALEGKKYLLLLDDVWEMVNLSAVGLPKANQENGCKVVLTTREREVCKKMRTDIEIKMKVLSNEEAWHMFYSVVGDVAMIPSIKPHAEEIVRKCDGLLLALKVVSGALRKEENVSVWRNFIRELKSPGTCFIEDVNKEVFTLLKVSYDHIKDIERKNCFLYCGLFLENHKIKKFPLIDYWRAEGLILGKLSLAEARDKGDAILQALIDSCLLERCEGDDKHVIMHDVVRDLVLAMTSSEEEGFKHLVRAGISVENMPEDEEWTQATRISFMEHGLENLPDSPDCQKLLTLLLRGNFELKVIPKSFFNKMHKLRVLDLSETHIKSLPTSISNLDSLRELDLTRCYYLVELPVEVGTLKGLEVLRVTQTEIKILPSWISKLTALKCLEFWSEIKLEISCGVICKLSQMEELELIGLMGCCEISDESADIIAEEVSSLTALSSLGFNFRTVTSLQHFLQNSQSWVSKRLEKFCFVVGKGDSTFVVREEFMKFKRHLKYEGGRGGEEGIILPWAINEVLSQSNCFILEDHGKLNTLSEVSVQNTNDELRVFYVVGCKVLENVVDRKGLEMDAFRNIEYLSLYDLPNLSCILYLEAERFPPTVSSINSFTHLMKLELLFCPRIKKLFSSGFMIRQLSNLEELQIYSCKGLQGMISEDEVIEYGALPKLKEVTLVDLPEFVSLFQGVPMSWPSLKELTIRDCPKLRKLPFNLNNAFDLKNINCGRRWWDALQWDNNAIQSRLQPLLFEMVSSKIPSTRIFIKAVTEFMKKRKNHRLSDEINHVGLPTSSLGLPSSDN